MANPPIPSWYLDNNTESALITGVVSYGQVDADTVSGNKTVFFWNNRKGTEDVAKMEDVTITVRDRNGGTGDTPGAIVEMVKNNWNEVRIDSLNETQFVPIGKGGAGSANPSGIKAMGTTGSTTNINGDSAVAWTASNAYSLNTIVKPTVDNGYIYKVTVAGVSGTTEPTWLTTDGLIVQDGTVVFTAIQKVKTPGANEILGLANNTDAEGTNTELAGGNFVQFTTHLNVPIDASSGLNQGMWRASYKFV